MPGELVLDMCAAPGGKTTQIAQYMKNRGTIIACDINILRLRTLRFLLERMDAENVLVYKLDGTTASDLGLEFDRILLDAPCSGNMIGDNDWFKKRDLDGIKKKSEQQKQLISAAASVLKKGGTLVYSTCSLEPEENEYVIDWATKNIGLSLVESGLLCGSPGITEFFGKRMPGMDLCRRMWPHIDGTQGFFCAKMIKN